MVDITYVTDQTPFAVYALMADGERPVLEILVHYGTHEIFVAAMDTTFVSGMLVKTDGIAHVDPGDPADVLCLGSLRQYVLPRAVDLMASVYVPNLEGAQL